MRPSRAGTSGSGSSARRAARSPCGSAPCGSRSRPRRGTARRSRRRPGRRVLAERRLGGRQRLELAVQALVLGREVAPECLPGLAALPAVDRHIALRVAAVAQELAAEISGGAAEEADPGAFGPVVELELRLPVGLDA